MDKFVTIAHKLCGYGVYVPLVYDVYHGPRNTVTNLSY